MWFRYYCEEMWFAHKDECRELFIQPLDFSDYFRKNKYWLKLTYRDRYGRLQPKPDFGWQRNESQNR